MKSGKTTVITYSRILAIKDYRIRYWSPETFYILFNRRWAQTDNSIGQSAKRIASGQVSYQVDAELFSCLNTKHCLHLTLFLLPSAHF